MTNFPSIFAPMPGNTLSESFTRPLDAILRFNVDVINSFQSAAINWVRRRQEAIKDTAECFESLIRSRDISEAMTIQREWVQRSMHRLDKDLSPVAIQTSEMVSEAAFAEQSAIARMSETAPVPVENHESAVGAAEENHLTEVEPPHKKARSRKKEGHTKRPESPSGKRRR